MLNPFRDKKNNGRFNFTLICVSLLITALFQFLLKKIFHNFHTPYEINGFSSTVLFFCFYFSFKKTLWRKSFLFRLGLSEFPDISGRWVGFLTSSYQRDGQNVIVPISLEIEQHASSLTVRAYFEKGFSESVMANVTTTDGRVHVHYLYDNSSPSKTGPSNDKGAVTLEYFVKDKRTLKGTYFNNMTPQPNHGEISVSYYGGKTLAQSIA